MIRRQAYSFKNATDGVFYVVKTQPNMLAHVFLSCAAVVLGLVLNISYVEFLIIGMLITVGLVIEMLNTAVELTIDSVHTDWHEKAKHAKDVSSGAMLLFAIGSVIISCIIFVPKIVPLL